MVVDVYRGHTVGKFWVRADDEGENRVVRVRHTVDERGNYYDETLTQAEAFQLGLALMRSYSINEFGGG